QDQKDGNGADKPFVLHFVRLLLLLFFLFFDDLLVCIKEIYIMPSRFGEPRRQPCAGLPEGWLTFSACKYRCFFSAFGAFKL
ncbi:MAG: hypothetical protein K2J24_00135, partial [Muribaculaceae bacterium]|nr:hypothetical protein [Muribaculaceae bacterium]